METFMKFVLMIFLVDVANSSIDKDLPVLFPTSQFLNSIRKHQISRPIFKDEDRVTYRSPKYNKGKPKYLTRTLIAVPQPRSANQPFRQEKVNIEFVKKEIPTCAKTGSSTGILCEEDSEYDSEIQKRFEEALKKASIDEKHAVYTSILSQMLVDSPGKSIPRFGGNILEDPVCPSTEKVIYPKRGMTQSDEWVFLLNQGKMEQGIKVEECLNTARFSRLREQSELSCGLGSDIDTACRQKYIYRNMLAMAANGSDIITESILVPSCCVCRRKNAAARVGDENTSVSRTVSKTINRNGNNEINSQSDSEEDFQYLFFPNNMGNRKNRKRKNKDI